MTVQSRGRLLQIENIGDVTVVRLTAQCLSDEETMQAIGQQLFDLVSSSGPRNIVVNFSDARSMSSTMVGKLFALHKRLRRCSGRLVLCGMSPELREVFEVLKLPQFCAVYEEEQEAMQSF